MLLYTTMSRFSINAPPKIIISSLSITMTKATTGKLPVMVWHSSAVTTITLSASGSISLPKAVIRLCFRAI